MHKIIKIIGLLILNAPSLSLAQSSSVEIDPVLVSPDNYKVVMENKHVRVVEYEIKAGERDNWHTHPAKVSYVLAGGTIKIVTAEGESFVVEEELESVRWLGAVGKHYAENVGSTPVRIIFVEIKQVEGVSQDLNNFEKNEPR